MSTPDDPTRRLPPADPPAVREREVVEEDPGWRAHLDDQLSTIRGLLLGIGLIALAALAIGVYLLATEDDDDDDTRAGASRNQVRLLEDRLDKLGSQVDDRAGKGALNQLEGSQSQLTERLDALEEETAQSDDAGDIGQLEQAVEDLSGDIQELSERVDEVEQEQQRQP